MNAHDLLDYHLGQLDADQRSKFEDELKRNVKLAKTSQLLGERLDMLLDEGDPPEPPEGLVGRTVFRVMNQEPGPNIISMPGQHQQAAPSFRWADLGVAAVILITSLGALLPAIEHARRNRLNIECVANLMNLGQGLNSYASANGTYPQPVSKTSLVGSYMFPLLETNSITSPAVLACPSGGIQRAALTEPSWRNWKSNPDRPSPDFQQFARRIYSYNPGYEVADGRKAPLSWEQRISRNQPLAADGPHLGHDVQVLPGNSPNHGGRGQYVLYTDGGVRYLTQRKLADDQDIYLNDRKQLSYGIHDHDVVLFPGDVTIERSK